MKKRPDKDHADQAHKPGSSDADYFARAMADVVRLPSDPRGRVRAAPHVSPPRAATPSTSSPGGLEIDESSAASYVATGVDRRELRKLKRGEYVAAGRLDLHGQTAADAVASVKRFIDRARSRHRCICIVHGRGLHSEGQVPILKRRVRECLRQQRAVLAYADAPSADGGAGAVYVLLRK